MNIVSAVDDLLPTILLYHRLSLNPVVVIPPKFHRSCCTVVSAIGAKFNSLVFEQYDTESTLLHF